MNGKYLKKVIENSGLPKGRLAAMMGVSYQAFAQYYRTTDLRQETLDKLDNAIRALTNDMKSLADFMPPLEPSADTIACEPLPPITSDVMESLKSEPGPAPSVAPVPRAIDTPEYERNIIEVYARVISDVENMHKQLERELSEVHALKSDLQRLIAALSSPATLPMAAESINENV